MKTTSDKPASRKRHVIWLIAIAGLLGGFIAQKAVYRKTGTTTDVQANAAPATTQTTAKEKQQLQALQEGLTSTAVFPENFRTVPAFQLIDQQGQAITESLFTDQWSMVFFGYTHCPDICPMTMTIMNNVVDKLAQNKLPPLQVVFVSVDPKRDTSDKLGQYMAYFNEDFKGITGELADVLALTGKLGIVASYTAIEGTDDYLVDHTASMLLVDPQGRIRAKFNAPHRVENIVSDFQKIVDKLS